MRRISLLIIAVCGSMSLAAAAEEQGAKQPSAPAEPQASGSTSSDLSRSGGVIKPPVDVDPRMKQTPPPSGDKMLVITPPGTPGSNPSVKPK